MPGLFGLLLATDAAACPDCPVGAQARERALELAWSSPVLLAAVPFVVVAIVCIAVEKLEAR